MKNFIKSPLNLFVAGLILASSFTFIQCTKPDTEGQITFVNLTTGLPISGAIVTLFIDTTKSNAGFFVCNSRNKITPQKEYTTNSSGQITQCFDLPALINVYAKLVIDATPDTAGWDSLTQIKILEAAVIEGEGKLNLIANEKTSITIKMN